MPAAHASSPQSPHASCPQSPHLHPIQPTQKLTEAGVTMSSLKAMTGMDLRKAGIVVKGQRDRILEALGNPPG